MSVLRSGVMGAAIMAALLACGSSAHADTISKCTAGKVNCAIAKAKCKLGCYKKAANTNVVDTETAFNLTYTNNGTQCVLQPFDDATTYGQSFKSKILPIEGIDLMSNANGHDTAGTILTGSYIASSKPIPRTSPMTPCFSFNSSSLPRRYLPTSTQFWRML